MQQYSAVEDAARLFDVDRVYVLHAKKNVQRGAFQLKQLESLNTVSWFVTGCDGEDLSVKDRECAWVASSAVSTPRGSEVIKANAALAHFLCSPAKTVMLLEDDAEVIPKNAHNVNAALQKLTDKFDILYIGSYSPNGLDPLKEGVHRKTNTSVPSHRGPGRMMPATSLVVSKRGAQQWLKYGGLVTSNFDMHMSDSRFHHVSDDTFYVKPYAFKPNQHLAKEAIGKA